MVASDLVQDFSSLSRILDSLTMFEFALLVVPSWRNHILRILNLLVDWWDKFFSPQDLNFGAQECHYQAAKEEFQFSTKVGVSLVEGLSEW